MNVEDRKYLKYVRIADLPEHYQDCVKAIGIVATFKLCEAFPGIPLYFKNIEKLLYPAKSAYIVDNFTGDNHRKLSIDTGLPLATVYEILTPSNNKKANNKADTPPKGEPLHEH